MNGSLPTGTITFLFTDIEGSTNLWEREPQAMKTALERHDTILRAAIAAHRGHLVKTTGDGYHAAFETAQDGLAAILEAQMALNQDPWEELHPQAILVRAALFTGEAALRAGDYYGTAVNRAARLMAIGHGGQVLLSAGTVDLIRDRLPQGVNLLDLGEHRLKDLVRPEHVYQLNHPSLPAEFPPLNSVDVIPNNLPIQVTSFIGRERELAEVQKILAANRLLTLTGPGGTGKTRLALQAAANLLPAYPQGVWLVEFASVNDPDMVLQTVAAIFQLREVRDGLPLQETIINYLRGKQLLLILDNCEHLIEACARLADHLLRTCPRLTLIASNREAFGIQGEMIYQVPSLSLPDADIQTAAELMQFEAVQLFVERATAVKPRFQLTGQNAPSVARICQRLDGIPLALELAAARISVFTPEQIAARLDDRFRLLTGGSRTALPRQQTLRALIDWSYDLLSAPEQALLRSLSVFAGGWTFEAAEAVCANLDVLDLLPLLVNKSLVGMTEQYGLARYGLLETIRQYTQDKLLDAGETQPARDHHLDYFVQLAEQASKEIFGAEALAWMDQVELEYDNIRAAFEWGVEHRPEDALRLVANLFFPFNMRSNLYEVKRWAQQSVARVAALPTASAAEGQQRTRLLARGYLALGQFYMSLGEMLSARQTVDKAIQAARSLQDPLLYGTALGFSSVIGLFLNDIQNTRTAAQESVTLLRKYSTPVERWNMLMSLGALSWAEGAQGNADARQNLLKEAQELVEQTDQPYIYEALLMLGLEARALGELQRARTFLERCLRMVPVLRSKTFEGMVRSELAHIHRQTGDMAEAKAAYHDTLQIWDDLGAQAAVAHQLECVAFIERAEGRPEIAAQLFGAAETLRKTADSLMTDYERPEYEQEVNALRQQMPEEELNRAWDKGRALSSEQAVALALEALCP